MKLKYILGIYNKLDGYPSNEDIFYELQLNPKESVFTKDNIKYLLKCKLNEDRTINFFTWAESKNKIKKINEKEFII